MATSVITLALTRGVPPAETVAWTTAATDLTPTFRVTVTGSADDISYLEYDDNAGFTSPVQVQTILTAGILSTGYYDYTATTLDVATWYVRVRQGRTHPTGTVLYSAWSSSASQTLTGGIEFGSLTRAAAGGYPVPSGATSITGGTATGFNMTTRAGYVTPTVAATMTAGTLIFNNGTTYTISLVTGGLSVSTHTELEAAVEWSSLTYGNSILLRSGAYNSAFADIAMTPPVGCPLGTFTPPTDHADSVVVGTTS